jgi:16S rRNA (guanine1207-N2)-methyltransferase
VPGHAEFRVGDGLAGVPDGSVDLVLNNPPFHSHQATTDATAWRMITGAKRVLRPGGELWVVGNRHLGYHVKLKRLFGNSRLVASDPKFVVLRAVKR